MSVLKIEKYDNPLSANEYSYLTILVSKEPIEEINALVKEMVKYVEKAPSNVKAEDIEINIASMILDYLEVDNKINLGSVKNRDSGVEYKQLIITADEPCLSLNGKDTYVPKEIRVEPDFINAIICGEPRLFQNEDCKVFYTLLTDKIINELSHKLIANYITTKDNIENKKETKVKMR